MDTLASSAGIPDEAIRGEWDASSVLKAALRLLSDRLPPRWTVESLPSPNSSGDADIVVKSEQTNAQTSLLVETKRSFAPRDVDALTGGLFARLRDRSGEVPILLVAPYLSARSRALLVDKRINYLDLTGNVRIALDYPGVFILTQGAQVDPAPASRGRSGLRGAKLGAVVRVLIDVRPPYKGAEIARAANVNEGYVSRILDTLLDEGLIARPRYGPVESVDWQTMIRQRAAALSLFRKGGVFRYVARNGPRQLLDSIAQLSGEDRPVITGSFAAVRKAPIAPPSQLVVYSMNTRALALQLPLVEVETGADTVLIRPENRISMTRPIVDGPLRFAAYSQVAIDCLSGSGRMPAEGEALIEWMAVHEDEWRLRHISDLDCEVDQ